MRQKHCRHCGIELDVQVGTIQRSQSERELGYTEDTAYYEDAFECHCGLRWLCDTCQFKHYDVCTHEDAPREGN